MDQPVPLVIATTNKGKIHEIRDLLKDYSVRIMELEEFDPIPSVEEDGNSFEENAYKKASFTSKVLGLPALADDSGLVVEALGGLPGIHSARYAGKNATDEQKCARILMEMKDRSNRKAIFECVISIAVPNGNALTYTAHSKGLIAPKPGGQNGFGYDPIFYYPPLQKTFAELTQKEKGCISHRGKALMALKNEFNATVVWICQHMPVQKKIYM
jgi:XTP/dITP diphosphohydrolase|tara:strand:+ start:1966 stop:2607 length:642 start_codon:yes stop_codon:yes gene_type:complete